MTRTVKVLLFLIVHFWGLGEVCAFFILFYFFWRGEGSEQGLAVFELEKRKHFSDRRIFR